jgi:hypothetical protein
MAYAGVRWFVAAAPLRARLVALIRSERLDDLVSVEPVPTPPGPGGEAARFAGA